MQWTSGATPHGVSGAATLATKEKGKDIVDAAAENLLGFIRQFRTTEKAKRTDHRAVKPKLPTLPSVD